jgi:phage/plasmid primase-like uncharacterized protein
MLTEDMKAQFLAAMATRGLSLSPGKVLIDDGQWHSCGNGHKSDGGSYKLLSNGSRPFGFYNNWRDGEDTQHWHGDLSRPLTEAEREELAQRLAELEKEAAEQAKKAAGEAWAIYIQTEPAPDDHPYLVRKKIKPHGARVNNHGALIIPMFAPDSPADKADRPVNLQYINPDGSKYYIKFGRAKGCYSRIEGDPTTKRVIIAEGFATGASIREAIGADIILAFSAGNLEAVATTVRQNLKDRDAAIWTAHQRVAEEKGLQHEKRKEFLDYTVIVAADDDWKSEGNPGLMKGLQGARAANALIALPNFVAGDRKRGDKETDFNDLRCAFPDDDLIGLLAVKEDIESAIKPNELVERRLVADPHSALDPMWAMELARIKLSDPAAYSRLRERLTGLKKVRIDIRGLDAAVKQGVEELKKAAARAKAQKATTQSKPDIDALARSAKDIIASKDVLGLFGKAFARAYAGEGNNAKLLYLIATSRLFSFSETMHAALKGTSAIGKSALADRVLRFQPEEDVIAFTAMSEKALLYYEDGFEHKILFMGEAHETKDTEFQDYCIRELVSAGRLRYDAAMKVGDEIKTVTIKKEGPVTFIVTTTRVSLNFENETRLLSLELDDSEKQTRCAMRMIARVRGLNESLDDVDFTPWCDFQRWLAAGETRVCVPFAPELSDLIPAKAVRVRRDLSQLIVAIKAHALLHREHRARTEVGEVIATIEDDYRVVRELMADILAEASEIKVSRADHETVEAVERAQPERGESNTQGATVADVKKVLKRDDETVRRRLIKCVKLGLLNNLNAGKGKGRTGRYVVVGSAGKPAEALPTPEALAKMCEAVEVAEAKTKVNQEAEDV